MEEIKYDSSITTLEMWRTKYNERMDTIKGRAVEGSDLALILEYIDLSMQIRDIDTKIAVRRHG